jgi:hypothetical protein
LRLVPDLEQLLGSGMYLGLGHWLELGCLA